ncbi:hypothetical protein GDO78_015182 [Eleutherodactylus coqui]|uniref:Uncharacterized protein n=1 Tax=Eleutherodactylus coqui TaxID=57060 RepID=A0A8J6EDV5_ELECQ|nr:hypothetical protein GDO78_015182 [Eleutherodactylus coqui]
MYMLRNSTAEFRSMKLPAACPICCGATHCSQWKTPVTLYFHCASYHTTGASGAVLRMRAGASCGTLSSASGGEYGVFGGAP